MRYIIADAVWEFAPRLPHKFEWYTLAFILPGYIKKMPGI